MASLFSLSLALSLSHSPLTTKKARLMLSDNILSGPIPVSLSQLNFLHTLRLNNNQLKGTIPQIVLTMSTLKELELQSNDLSGKIDQISCAGKSILKVDCAGQLPDVECSCIICTCF